MAIKDNYDIVIGLEVHCQLKTQTKLFCGCPNRFGSPPNTHVCPVCLGMPGTLPVPNRQAFDYGIAAALALGAKISATTKFDRKHYFYPDLPKGYQISQYDEPYCRGGGLEICLSDGTKKFIELNRIHLEEDAGKLSHAEDSKIADSLVDLNRAGTPLIEIVSEPVMTSPEEAVTYLATLRQVLMYIDVSDCNMQEGSIRCDVNVSLKPKGSEKLGTKVEIKNMNSFKFITAALEYEIRRQHAALESGEKLIQETRLYDVDRGVTISMRSKEKSDDYRYFPDPDLPRIVIDEAWISEIRSSLGTLPGERRRRLREEYGLPDYDIEEIMVDKTLADYFDACAEHTKHYKEISNWIMGEIKRSLGERKVSIDGLGLPPARLAELIEIVAKGTITKTIAREKVFSEMLDRGESAVQVVEKLGLKVENDDAVLLPIVEEAIAKNPEAVADIRAGKGKALGALVGYCMKASRGKANPQQIGQLLTQKIAEI